ncbi:uncharacterized protein [Periplaneta americana]|uniref:uncharacterized protein n=1 Tax=Periplaneta americana TaxID=6978 RepID=UPI0037E98496
MPPISRPASSTYWTPPSNRQRRLSEIPSAGSRRKFSASRTAEGDMSSNISTSTSRHYVDPWDLENYAFMKRHCTDGETDYVVTSTPALESSQSDFYYVPQYNGRPDHHGDSDDEDPRQFARYRDDSIGLVNGVEEEDFYNERYELTYSRYSPGACYLDLAPRLKFRPTSCLYTRTDAGDSYEDYDPCADDSAALYSDDSTALASSGSYGREVYNPRLECQLYSPSVMLRRAPSRHSEQSLVYVYETGSRRRKMALPKGNLGAPAPLLRRNSTNSHHLTNYRSRMVQGRLSSDSYPSEMSDGHHLSDTDPPYMMASYDDLHHPYYDIYCSKPLPVTPQHFGLSKYGHLKIDYSFSWNSLDRYIATD